MEYHNPKELFDSKQFGFSQIVVAKPGRHVYISGQVAWDADRKIVGKGDLALQIQQSIDNLAIALASLGGSLQDVVILRIYKVHYQESDGPIISEALLRNFDSDHLPASTWVSVDGLANEEFMIEIEAQAVI